MMGRYFEDRSDRDFLVHESCCSLRVDFEIAAFYGSYGVSPWPIYHLVQLACVPSTPSNLGNCKHSIRYTIAAYNSLCLNDDFNSQNYEYDTGVQRIPLLATNFFYELKDYLIENGLERLVAVVPKTVHKTLERLDSEQTAI